MNYQMLKANFERHGFATSYFETKAEAASYLKEQVKGRVVGFGGSMTVKELDLYPILGEHNTVIWHWQTPGDVCRNAAQSADVYICSANGVAQTGELVNIDGTGNRLAMTIFGPQKVYFLIGSNKICPDLQAAIYRAKNVAAPKNAMRFNRKTPCVASGGERCFDCTSPERICNATLILERPTNGVSVELVFINQELGY